ncbi:putative membrane protein, Yip1 family [Halapricum desulfuricans]|uniref:Putative membrane protein, Yip1 family n=1 Tax=Halapricum desulfuricans TaxID=2841257 RepID=A0A897NPS6_9EURY|nr:YIP1 family protein [Halapricum desulfuricans]QSG12839.1 putative membrane protein, Yip1 family [Halapricum desulfuricans]
MTQWIEDPEGGRDRGPRAVARAWFEVLTAPRRFFRTGVAPADQAPGLFFLMAVVFVAEGGRYLLVADGAPAVSSHPIAGPALALALTVVLVAPVALHLLVALQTLVLMALVSDRAGVSETVQVLAYASAPCVAAGVPVPAVRLACGAYGFVLLVVGIAVVHETSYRRATLAAIPVGAIGFGYGFRAFGAASELLSMVSTVVGFGGIV